MANYSLTTNYPTFSNGNFYINGEKKASTFRDDGGNVSSSYNMNDFEKKTFQYVQESLANSIPSINTLSPATIKDINSQVDAFKSNAIKEINDTYSPMLTNLKQDMATRFGNLDNSIFMDNLNSIENKRADAINYLAQDVVNKKNELVSNELTNRYNYLNFLNDYQNNALNNIYRAIGVTQNNSNNGNSYNNNLYNANYKSDLYNQKLKSDLDDFNQQILQSVLMTTIGL